MLHSSDYGPGSETANRHRMVLEERIREKISDYAYYKFTVRQTRALNIFFDLAQEYEDLLYLYHLPVQVLQFFFNLKAELYARDDSGSFVVQTPKVGPETSLPTLAELSLGPRPSLPSSSDASDAPSTWWFFPVKGRPSTSRTLRDDNGSGPQEAAPTHRDEREILAVLAILPQSSLTEHEKLFYEKFANRLGFCLHNRILALKNLEHIEFVRTLVHDIGHNVIVPNLHFKLLMRQMADKISALRQLSDTILCEREDEITSLHTLCDRIEEHYDEISKHFHQSSFFLETLLRQSHFDQGRYVLQRTVFNLVSRVVAPQFERYRLRFQERDIAVAEDYDADTARLTVNGDIGLLSQVIANFFSNAVKYTRQTPGKEGLLVRCSVHAFPNVFGEGRDGVRVEVLSTGVPIPRNEADQLFSENFRASNTENEHGTGHGLYFSRLIINQHGGQCGYRNTEEGNIFYLVLPIHNPELDGPA
ncbi:Histidine kinase [uncultured delta proteobacterium]|uniref:histidine kinase n=1 Tax=uncultured delta proteobacterium TaxID=34034 RepID=A0A212JZU8_9DELT|nr:Histidine kinase [uncultured delta proteobacterium]